MDNLIQDALKLANDIDECVPDSNISDILRKLVKALQEASK